MPIEREREREHGRRREETADFLFPSISLPGTCSIIKHPDDSTEMQAGTDRQKARQIEEIHFQTSSSGSNLVSDYLRDEVDED